MLRQRLRAAHSFGILSLLLFTLPLTRAAVAQPFYTFTSEKGEYQELVGSTTVRNTPGTLLTDTIFALDLGGEMFNFYGKEYRCDENTPFLLYGGGFIRFDNANSGVVIDGFLSFLDYLDEESQVSYLIDQNEEEKILKVEWKKMALIDSPNVVTDDYISFQVWVYQGSGIVEMRYGPRSIPVDSGVMLGGGPYVGIFRFAESPFRIFEKNWLVGDPFNPTYDTKGVNFELLNGCPGEGTIFRMTPRVASGVDEPEGEGEKDAMGEYRIFPNPTAGTMTLQAAKPLRKEARIRLVDLLGRTVSETEMDRSVSTLDLELPYPGLYYCEVTGESGTQVYSVVRR